MTPPTNRNGTQQRAERMRNQRGQVAAWVAITLVGIVLIAIGGWQLGWWMKNYSVNQNARIYQNGYGAQSAWSERVQNEISTIRGIDVQIAAPQTPATEVSALQSQRAALVTQACQKAAQINQPPSDVATFISTDCGAGQ